MLSCPWLLGQHRIAYRYRRRYLFWKKNNSVKYEILLKTKSFRHPCCTNFPTVFVLTNFCKGVFYDGSRGFVFTGISLSYCWRLLIQRTSFELYIGLRCRTEEDDRHRLI